MLPDLESDQLAVVTRNLRRVFDGKRGGQRVALEGASLAIGRAEVHGLLGPNGAGKTTLCKILSTVLVPTSGTAAILGHDVVSASGAVRQLIGIMFGGERGLYSRLTARQNLVYWSALYKLPRADGRLASARLLERVGLAGRADERVETFSRGMKQRLHLARSLIGDPKVVLLDEPTAGMDPVAAREFRALVAELREDGRSVLLATHDMAEAEAVCDRVTLIDRGRILATEDPSKIGRMLSPHERITADAVPPDAIAAIGNLPGVIAVAGDADSIVVEVASESAARAVLQALVASGVRNLSTRQASLEEAYLRLIGDRGLSV